MIERKRLLALALWCGVGAAGVPAAGAAESVRPGEPSVPAGTPAEVAADNATNHTEMLSALWQLDQQVKRNPRAIQPHKRNYYTLSYFDSDLSGSSLTHDPFGQELDHAEIKFQISMRVPLVEGLFGSDADLYTAYTATSFWQAFNNDISSPFREINHEPELFVLWPAKWRLGPIRARVFSFGFNHQSNGQFNRALTDDDGVVAYENASRSWNRIMLGAYFEQENFLWHLQTWYRLPEEAKDDPQQAKGDDNPDIEDYLGNFELSFFRMLGRYSGAMMVRNNLDFSRNRGALQLDFGFPMARKLDGLVQVFHGYGDSLLDYNSRNTRVSIGFALRGF